MPSSSLRPITPLPAVALATLLIGCTPAEDNASAAPADRPVALQPLLERGFEVHQGFDAGGELDGWVMVQAHQPMVVYTTADGELLISGVLVNAEGENLTARHLEQHRPAADLAAVYQALEEVDYIAEGEASAVPPVYVFFDPRCSHCHDAWRGLQPWVERGLELRWVPVALMGRQSAAQAAALLHADERGAALAALMSGDGEPPVAQIGARAAEQLQAHSELMGRAGLTGTPGFVWADGQGGYQAQSGFPGAEALAERFGLAESQRESG